MIIDFSVSVFVTTSNYFVKRSSIWDESCCQINLFDLFFGYFAALVCVQSFEYVLKIIFVLEVWGLETTGQKLVIIDFPIVIGVDMVEDTLEFCVCGPFLLFFQGDLQLFDWEISIRVSINLFKENSQLMNILFW